MGSKGSQSSSSSQTHILTIQGAMEIRVARVVRVAAVVTHILTIQGAMEIRVARVVKVAAVVKVIFSQYRGLWKYG